MQKMRINAVLLLVGLCVGSVVNAFEVYNSHPGGRAVSMAGAFSAQADDSTAIWYNPAGLKRMSGIKRDFTIEWGQLAARSLAENGVENTSGTGLNTVNEEATKTSTLKFMAAYVNKVPYITSDSIGMGLAFYTPYRLSINIDQRRSEFDNRPIGEIELVQHQLSPVVSYQLHAGLSVGGGVDVVWNDVTCSEHPACVQNEAFGYGITAGAIYDLYHAGDSSLKISAVWRTKADVGYKSTGDRGIDSVIEDYMVDRPKSRIIGLSYQAPNRIGVVNSNIQFEKIYWSDSSGGVTDVGDFNNIGVGAELIIATGWLRNLALRGGWKRSASDNDNSRYDVVIKSAGLGYAVFNDHFVDFALERRDSDVTDADSGTALSLSYTYQH